MKKYHIRSGRLLLLALLIISATTVSVLALFLKSTPETKNTFTAAVSVNPEITELFEENLKEDACVKITDKGYPVYVRCAVVINWKDENGNIHIENPVENTDYILEAGENWTKMNDGFYYYNTPIQTGETAPLIIKCEPVGNPPDPAYKLSVNIISQTIQAVGSTDEKNIPAHMLYKEQFSQYQLLL